MFAVRLILSLLSLIAASTSAFAENAVFTYLRTVPAAELTRMLEQLVDLPQRGLVWWVVPKELGAALAASDAAWASASAALKGLTASASLGRKTLEGHADSWPRRCTGWA